MSSAHLSTYALLYDRYGGLDVLRFGDLALRPPRPGEVLVRVRAAALNPKDVLVRKGRLRWMSGSRFPKIVGLDFAGEVAQLGTGVRGLRVGDRVFGCLNERTSLRGTLSTYVLAQSGELAPMPPRLSFEEAAAVPLAAQTSLQALRDVAEVRAGDRVLIHGAAGGVGTWAIQLAKLLGAHVTTTSGEGNLALCRELGADEALDYRRDPLFDGSRTYRVVYDVFGNQSLARVRKALRPDGVYVTTVPSPRIALDTARTLVGGQRARLVIIRSRTADLQLLAGWLAEGRLRPVIDRVVDLPDVLEAIRHIETRHARGKIVVRVG